MKAKRESERELCIFCPGCREVHVIDQRWTFNGNVDAPTFTPSLHVKRGHYCEDRAAADCGICREFQPTICGVCHSWIKDGRIQFLSDCTHALAGQTVDLPEWAGFDPDNYV